PTRRSSDLEQRRFAGALAEIPWLAAWLARATHDAVEALAAQGAQQQRQFFRLIQQVQQGHVEQALDAHLRQADSQQAVGAAVGRYDQAGLVEDHPPRPWAAEGVLAAVEGQLKV